MHMQSLTGVRSVHCEVADRRPVTALAALIALIALVVLIETRQSDYSSSTTAVCLGAWQATSLNLSCRIARNHAHRAASLLLMQEQDDGE
jgi:hypothetical protein